MRPHVEEIRRAGGDLYIVGNGAPLFAQGFREELKLDEAGIPVWTDEPRGSYALLGFRRPRGVSLASLRIAKSAVRAAAKGYTQKRTMGDAAQLGGVLVVRPDGAIVYRFASEVAGDHAPLGEIVDAVGRAAR